MTHESRVDELLVDWELARREGRALSPEELCGDDQLLIPEVAEKIAVLARLSWLGEPAPIAETQEPRPALRSVKETDLPDTDVTVAEFIKVVTESGLVRDPQQAQFQETIPAFANKRALQLAQHLIAQKLITPYQAKVILERGDSPLLLDRYIILDAIGSGGMGIVFKALQRSLERVVAVKILPCHAVDSAEKVERFQREMRAVARLSHPHVVQAIDAHESNGVYFFAMEYVAGCDLADLVLNQGSCTAEAAMEIIAQVAAGLEHAHQHGIVHRDVKPANILLSDDGVAKVLDLGLARTREQAQATADNQLTRDGLAMGTVAYMSPEQAFDAKQADERSDVYSLGCTLYFLLHGRPLFEVENGVQLVIAHRESQPPRLAEGREDVSVELEELFQRMVAKDPHQRPQSMDVVRTELLQLLATPQVDPASDEQDGTTRKSSEETIRRSVISTDAPAAENSVRTEKPTLPTPFPTSGNWTSMGPRKRRRVLAVVTVAVALIPIGWLVRDWMQNKPYAIAKQLLEHDDTSLLVQTTDGTVFLADYLEDLPDEPFRLSGMIVYPESQIPRERFAALSDLRSLTIVSPYEGQAPLSEFWAQRPDLPELEELAIDGFQLDSQFLGWLSKSAALKSVDLSGCTLPNPKLAWCQGLPQLQELSLMQTNVEDADLESFTACPSLVSIDLSNTDITSAGLQALVKLERLQSLALTSVDSVSDLEILRAFPRLTSLYLDGNDIHDREMQNVLELRELHTLHIGHTQISATSLRDIARLDRLEELMVEGLPIQNAVEAICSLPKLTYLNAQSTDLTDTGLELLASVRSLQTLVVANTLVTDKAIQRFQLKRPSCQVLTQNHELLLDTVQP